MRRLHGVSAAKPQGSVMNKQPTRLNRSVQLRLIKARFMAGFLPPLVLIFSLQTARAGSATWNLNPTSNDWYTAANWTPATVPNDPSDIATLDVSNVTALQSSGVDLAEMSRAHG